MESCWIVYTYIGRAQWCNFFYQFPEVSWYGLMLTIFCIYFHLGIAFGQCLCLWCHQMACYLLISLLLYCLESFFLESCQEIIVICHYSVCLILFIASFWYNYYFFNLNKLVKCWEVKHETDGDTYAIAFQMFELFYFHVIGCFIAK